MGRFGEFENYRSANAPLASGAIAEHDVCAIIGGVTVVMTAASQAAIQQVAPYGVAQCNIETGTAPAIALSGRVRSYSRGAAVVPGEAVVASDHVEGGILGVVTGSATLVQNDWILGYVLESAAADDGLVDWWYAPQLVRVT